MSNSSIFIFARNRMHLLSEMFSRSFDFLSSLIPFLLNLSWKFLEAVFEKWTLTAACHERAAKRFSHGRRLFFSRVLHVPRSLHASSHAANELCDWCMNQFLSLLSDRSHVSKYFCNINRDYQDARQRFQFSL